jgi:tetratricopeptide (TPR) repeat protein
MSSYTLGLDRLAKYSLLGLLFYVPLTVGAGAFNDVKAIIFAVCAISGGALALLIWEERAGKRVSAQKLLWKVMGLFILFSLFFLADPISLRDSAAAVLLVFSYFLTYGVISTRLREEKEIYFSLWALLVSATLVSLKGINQYLYEFSALSRHITAQGLPISLEGRAFATFIGPNALAGFLLLSLPAALSLALIAKTLRLRLFAWICSGFLVAALILTLSKAGIVIAAILLVVFAALSTRGKRRRIAVGLLGLAATVVFLAILLARGGAVDISRPLLSLQSSFAGRVGFWETSLEITERFPMRGSGIGTFGNIYPRFQRSGAYSQHAHNSYLEMFAETGLVGGALFLVILGLVLSAIVRAVRGSASSRNKQMIIGLSLGTLGFLLHNMVDFDWYIPASGLYFWAFAGLAVALGETGKSASRESSFQRSPRLGLVKGLVWGLTLVLVLFAGGYFLSLYQADALAEKGRSALKRGAWDEAVSNLKEAVERDPLEANYHSLLAQGYAGQSLESDDKGRLAKAIVEMRRATELQPTVPYLRGLLGTYYRGAGQSNNALREWQKAKELAPRSPVYYNLAGSAHFEMGKSARAAVEFKKAISLARLYREGKTGVPLLRREAQSAPRAVYEAYLRLAAIYLSQGEDRRALELYGQAVEFSSQETAAYHALASYNAAKGNLEEAMDIYAKVLRLDPQDITARFRLGLIYEQIGQYEQAHSEYQEILRIRPQTKEAQERLEQLDGK